MSKLLKGKFHELHIDIAFEPNDNVLRLLQEIIEQFEFEIVALAPIGPAGGNAFLVFKGTYEKIKSFLKDFYFNGDEREMEMMEVEEWIVESKSDELHVMFDDRFVTKNHRKYVSLEGAQMYI